MFGFVAFGDGLEDAELFGHVFGDFHDGGDVVTTVAVVRSRPYGD